MPPSCSHEPGGRVIAIARGVRRPQNFLPKARRINQLFRPDRLPHPCLQGRSSVRNRTIRYLMQVNTLDAGARPRLP